ncbi:hypothetical protein [Hydrogenophaga sp. ANAO-22]|uniref:hypothetical protein n=1 Tax=Hydrogenophaga sp. ANAO-22 TaxID=3166645 RepID=UPI0036D263EF
MKSNVNLAFTDEAREYLKSLGFSNFKMAWRDMPTLPAIGDTMWLDSTDDRLMFSVTDRTFMFNPGGDASLEIELGLLGPASDR